MVGKTEEEASPTILVYSPDKSVRKDVRKAIDKSEILKRHPGVLLADAAQLPDHRRPRPMGGLTEVYGIPGDRQVVGRRLFLYPKGQPSRTATAGPILFFGDKIYQLTVGHIFQDDTCQ